MRKVYLNVVLNVIVECDDNLSTDDIIERLDFDGVQSDDECVWVDNIEVENFNVVDSK